MSETEPVAGYPTVRSPLFIVCVTILVMCTILGLAGWLIYSTLLSQAESGKSLAIQVREACDNRDLDLNPDDRKQLCDDADKVIEEKPIDSPEIQEAEVQEPEIQESEIQESEIQERERQGRERQQRELQDAEEQEAEEQESEIQDGEEQEPEIQDPENDDPDPNSMLNFAISDMCNAQDGMVIIDISLGWERTGDTLTLVLTCTQAPDQTFPGGGNQP